MKLLWITLQCRTIMRLHFAIVRLNRWSLDFDNCLLPYMNRLKDEAEKEAVKP
jgi:hypothetical protein